VKPPIPLFPRFFVRAGAAFFPAFRFLVFDFAFFAFFAMIIFRYFRLSYCLTKRFSSQFCGGLAELVIGREGAWPHFFPRRFTCGPDPLRPQTRRRAAAQRDELATV
jgi:hypothetical protein